MPNGIRRDKRFRQEVAKNKGGIKAPSLNPQRRKREGFSAQMGGKGLKSWSQIKASNAYKKFHSAKGNKRIYNNERFQKIAARRTSR